MVPALAGIDRDMQKSMMPMFNVPAQQSAQNWPSNNKDDGRGGGNTTPIIIHTTVELDKKAVGHSISPIVSKDLAFAMKGGKV